MIDIFLLAAIVIALGVAVEARLRARTARERLLETQRTPPVDPETGLLAAYALPERTSAVLNRARRSDSTIELALWQLPPEAAVACGRGLLERISFPSVAFRVDPVTLVTMVPEGDVAAAEALDWLAAENGVTRVCGGCFPTDGASIEELLPGLAERTAC